MGEHLEHYSFNVAAAHTDSPAFRVKENAEIHMGQKYTRLNTEGYGGMICSTWLDRPLSVAGRVLVKEGDAIVSRLVALDRDLLLIPSVAIHMNREVNDKASFNKQVDMLPLLGGAAEEGILKKMMNCVDIGLPQLAMHSCYETAGAEDIVSLIRLMREFYSSHFEETGFGTLAVHGGSN